MTDVVGMEGAKALAIKGWKDVVETREPDVFYRLFEKLGKQINWVGGSPHYIIDVPGDGIGYHWTVCLTDRVGQFIEQYRDERKSR